MNFGNYAAILSAFFTVGSAASIMLGHPAAGAVLADPNTATALTGGIAAIFGIVSAFAPSVSKAVTAAQAVANVTK